MHLNRCSSNVGRYAGLIQTISINSVCGSFSTAVHEIGHVLGFFHEHSRPDRDKYVTIHDENIIPGTEINYQKETDVNSLGVTYDFNSIMHYNKYGFTKNGKATISAKEKNLQLGIGRELSPLDIKQTNLLYKDQCS